MKCANIVVYRANAEGGWDPLKAEDTPEDIKEPEIMGEMVSGLIIEYGEHFYRARKLSDSKIVMHEGRSVMHKRPVVQ